jgi:hypothetical protein
MQCNGFDVTGASMMISIARIPWLTGQFVGFLGFVRFPESGGGAAANAPGRDTAIESVNAERSEKAAADTPARFRQVRFGTFSGAKLSAVEVAGNQLRVTVAAGSLALEIEAERTHSGTLAAPVGGAMDRRIAESLDAQVALTVSEAGKTLFEGKGTSAGVELVGVIDSLVPRKRTQRRV